MYLNSLKIFVLFELVMLRLNNLKQIPKTNPDFRWHSDPRKIKNATLIVNYHKIA